jgi:hypothetical protein
VREHETRGRQPAAQEERARPARRSPAIATTADRVLAIQRVAGNRAVAALTATHDRDRVVHRKLDATRFSAKAYGDKNLEGGFRLIGKSKFTQLTEVLTTYHAATTQAQELAALHDLVSACDAWLTSSYRSKKHSKSKGEEEAKKTVEVRDLKVAANAEIDAIGESLEPGTFDAMPGDARLVAAVRTLAKHLGLDVAGLAQLSADELTALYVDKVYAKVQMDRKANRETGAGGKVNEVLVKVLEADASQLPDGDDVKTVVQTVKAAKLGDRIAMGSKRAGKLTTGGTDTDTLTPSLPGWSDESQIKIDGNKDFRGKVAALLDVIADTKVGAALLAELGAPPEKAAEGEVHGTVKKTVLEIVPPAVSSAQRMTDDGTVMYSNSAAGTKIALDPDNHFVGENVGQGAQEPWRVRDAAVGLFHEMVHIYIKKKGGEVFTQEGETLQISDQGDMAEIRIVGIPYEKPKKGGGKVTFPFHDRTFNPFTENEFRKQFAALKGETEFYLRPTYAKVVGQVPLPTTPQQVT